MIYSTGNEAKMVEPRHERREYLRVEKPLRLRVITKENVIYDTGTKDISPLGLRFSAKGDNINTGDAVELTIEVGEALSPIHAKSKVVWKRRISTEDGTPFDIGCEFTKIEEDNKNTFLKYFCDLLYEHGA